MQARRTTHAHEGGHDKIEKTGYKLHVHLKDYWPGKLDADMKPESQALFYRNSSYLAQVDLDDPKAVEFEFKECHPGEVLRIYFLANDSDDIDNPDFCVSFDIKEYFMSGGKMVDGQLYETNIVLYDHAEEDLWNGVFGEHDFPMNGEEPVVQSHFQLKQFKYEVENKPLNAKPRAGRASRSPLKGRHQATKAEADALFHALQEKAKGPGFKKKWEDNEVIDEGDLADHKCIYDHMDFKHNAPKKWGKHQYKDYFNSRGQDTSVEVICPNKCTTGQKQEAGRDFLGGHYVSDLFVKRDDIKNHFKLKNEEDGGCTNFKDSKQYSKKIAQFYEIKNEYSLTQLDDRKKRMPRDKTDFFYSTEVECRTTIPDSESEDDDKKNVYCPDAYSRSFKGFKRFDFQLEKAPTPDTWDVNEIKNEYSSGAKRPLNYKNDIPAEKIEALRILDAELAKHTTAEDNTDADNQLEETLNWLRKRQNDTIALENRQMCRLYEIDLFADEMQKIDKHSNKRDKKATDLKRDNTEHNRVFGTDVQEQDIQAKIGKTERDLTKQRKILKDLNSTLSKGCIKLGMEPDKACKDAYKEILAKEIDLLN